MERYEMKRPIPLAAAAMALSLGLSTVANALTVTEISAAPTSWATALAATPDTLNLPGTWDAAPSTRLDNLPGIYRSPFDNEVVGGDETLEETKEYWAVGPDNPTNPAVMSFGGVAQTSLSFLWGSVDTYNTLRFFLNDVLVGAVTDFTFAPQKTFGASYVTVTGVVFDKIEFGSTGSNAFEFSNLSTTPVPIPAAAWLLGSGLLGLFGLSRRRKSGQSVAA